MNKFLFPQLPTASAPLSMINVGGGAAAKIIADLLPQWRGNVWVIVAEPETAENLLNDIAIWTAADEKNATEKFRGLLFPAWDLLPTEVEQIDLDRARGRLNVLRALTTPQVSTCVVLPITALLQPTLSPNSLHAERLTVSAGTEISPLTLSARLQAAGFTLSDVVEAPGYFARRGGIIDVFPFFAERPTRLEFFGDVIETVRFFDSVTQMSAAAHAETVTLIELNRDTFARAENSTPFTAYLTPETLIIFVEPEMLRTPAEFYYSGYEVRGAPKNPLFKWATLYASLTAQPCIFMTERGSETATDHVYDVASKGLTYFAGCLATAVRELETLVNAGNALIIYCHNVAEKQRLTELLTEKSPALADRAQLKIGNLTAGFFAPQFSTVIATAHEILGRAPLRRVPKKRSSPLNDFTELKVNDYVVHIAHGIARYEGIETLTNKNTQQDFLRLRFADDARLYVPLSHVELVQRYIGGGHGRPTLSKLGTNNWQRKKNAAAAAARDIAADLLRLQAARHTLTGLALPADDALQKEFDAEFPYEETPDQLSAISDIKNDQQKPTPMDRLLCGDVGFGKTEVAIRAAFKAVNNGLQVAVLVPTTILAEQHCRTFKERMAGYPVNIASVSRFCDDGIIRQILRDLREGKVDIIIGTHRLLSRDVQFKNLGLVVIDEEQRFGVEQKERLKEMRVCVDVLTMTATPIPRTLNMALLGLRDISNLTTPPTERQAVRTEVVRYSDELIRRVILRELARGGQVFFLHNRVYNITQIADHLRALIPEAKFAVAHGQMDEGELYAAMDNFLSRRADVLVCTTIIETGVDIPSVNTLIVHNAEHFGLGQLHQLRGRVGRYKHQAYAYFLLPEKRPASPEAQKRLRALEEYSELGAGFRLAMRDLEIRGTGNILGAEQSGHINLVGFELYCNLLEKSVAELKGEPLENNEPVELDLGTVAYLPADYITNETQRIDFYRKLNHATTAAELFNLKNYLRDRYGALPRAAENLFDDQDLRLRARAGKINYLGRLDNALIVGFGNGAGNDEIAKLKMSKRKVTPLENNRWRVALHHNENFIGAALLITHQR